LHQAIHCDLDAHALADSSKFRSAARNNGFCSSSVGIPHFLGDAYKEAQRLEPVPTTTKPKPFRSTA